MISKRAKQQAPMGKFRIVGVDTFSNEDWVEGDFVTLEQAKHVANQRGGEMRKMYIYNDQGNYLYEAGTY